MSNSKLAAIRDIGRSCNLMGCLLPFLVEIKLDMFGARLRVGLSVRQTPTCTGNPMQLLKPYNFTEVHYLRCCPTSFRIWDFGLGLQAARQIQHPKFAIQISL
jgi:hypothetical protein